MVTRRILAPFLPTLTLAEAEELERQHSHYVLVSDEGSGPELRTVNSQNDARGVTEDWRTALFAGLALIGMTNRAVEGVFNLVYVTRSSACVRRFSALCFLTAATWAYALFRVLNKTPKTPPYDLFILGILHLIHGVLTLGEQWYLSLTLGSLRSSLRFLAPEAVNIGITIMFLAIIMSLPLNLPSSDVDRTKSVSNICIFQHLL